MPITGGALFEVVTVSPPMRSISFAGNLDVGAGVGVELLPLPLPPLFAVHCDVTVSFVVTLAKLVLQLANIYPLCLTSGAVADNRAHFAYRPCGSAV